MDESQPAAAGRLPDGSPAVRVRALAVARRRGGVQPGLRHRALECAHRRGVLVWAAQPGPYPASGLRGPARHAEVWRPGARLRGAGTGVAVAAAMLHTTVVDARHWRETG